MSTKSDDTASTIGAIFVLLIMAVIGFAVGTRVGIVDEKNTRYCYILENGPEDFRVLINRRHEIWDAGERFRNRIDARRAQHDFKCANEDDEVVFSVPAIE